MAHHDVVENNPKKEFVTSLAGVLLFALLIAGIVVSAYLRPAGDHQPMITDAEPQATLVNAESEAVAPAQAKNAGVDNQTDPVLTTTVESPSNAPVNTASTTPPSDATAGMPAGENTIHTTATEASELDVVATPSTQAETTQP